MQSLTSRCPTIRRTLGVCGFALILIVAGCGGGDDGARDTAEPTAAPSAKTAGAGSSDKPSGSAGSGFVDVGGTRYDVRVLDCVRMAGAVGGHFVGVDDPDNIGGNYSFSPQDWQSRPATEGWTETGDISLKIDDPYTQWETGYSLLQDFNFPAGVSAKDLVVTAVKVDPTGSLVSGEAMFVDTVTLFSGDSKPAPGTFQFSCPE